ncbi:winged helix-turn-helix domain-containing protein, partial [Desulfosporosinus metallidurans]|uniref:winged helix-turn-helix domain-containing protein n=1 Tax=Desulfosporosinus metallidurans TaxID=1888891 RepID=UPI000A9F6D7F
ILNVVRQYGPISRAKIAKLTKLTPPTVTNLVGELIESHLVVESTLGESTDGRNQFYCASTRRHSALSV